LYSHNREESRFRLLSLKADELKEQELSIEKHIKTVIKGNFGFFLKRGRDKDSLPMQLFPILKPPK